MADKNMLGAYGAWAAWYLGSQDLALSFLHQDWQDIISGGPRRGARSASCWLRLIPIDHGRELAAALGTRAELVELRGRAHNDLWRDPRTAAAIRRVVAP